MDVLETLPARPLAVADAERFRAHETVTQFTALGSPAYARRDGGVKRVVALIAGTIVDLTFEDGTWERTILAREADQRHHLEEALEQLEQ